MCLVSSFDELDSNNNLGGQVPLWSTSRMIETGSDPPLRGTKAENLLWPGRALWTSEVTTEPPCSAGSLEVSLHYAKALATDFSWCLVV